MRKIFLDGIERDINEIVITKLTDEFLSAEADDTKAEFCNELIFRMADLELDSSLLHGKSAEEYYFAACLAYVKEKGFDNLYNEMDDGKIFDYCGIEIASLEKSV